MGSHCHPRWEQPVMALNLKEWSEERMKIKAKCNCWCNALPGMKGRSLQWSTLDSDDLKDTTIAQRLFIGVRETWALTATPDGNNQ
jgi:hypothetical protein